MKTNLHAEGFTIVIDDSMQNGKALTRSHFKYELHIKKWIYQNVPGKILFNIGANYGIHVLNAVRAQATHVYAYEVIPDVYNNLIETINLNGLHDKVTCYNVAIGDKNGIGYLCNNAGDNGIVNWNIQQEGEQIVQTRMLSEYLTKINPKNTIFLMDVEGSEFKVMAGMADYIQLYKPKIVFEILRDSYTKKEITDNITWLGSLGYKFKLFNRPNQSGIETDNINNLLVKIDEMKDGVMDIELIS